MTLAVGVLFALAGLTVGSFLNVVIWRLPRGESVVMPRSRCPGCRRTIAWYDNVPLLSWALLRARCRGCGARISVRYPLVEALTAALFLLAWRAWPGQLATAAIVAAVLAALLAVSVIDWEHKIIPDAVTRPGIVLALLLAPATGLHPPGWVRGLTPALGAWSHAAAGAAVGALTILLVRWVGTLIFRKEAMGLGDAKLLALIGALVGPLGVLQTLLLACLSGAILGVLRLLWARRRPLRLGATVRRPGGILLEVDRGRIDGEVLLLDAPAPPPEPGPVALVLVLPAAAILEDEDARIEVAGVLEGGEAVGGGHRWRVRASGASEEDRERLALLAASLRYVPFGPFLALGGGAVLLAAERVTWWLAEGWPRLVRGLL